MDLPDQWPSRNSGILFLQEAHLPPQDRFVEILLEQPPDDNTIDNCNNVYYPTGFLRN